MCRRHRAAPRRLGYQLTRLRISIIIGCAIAFAMSGSEPALGVIGGTPAPAGQFPFVVALVEPGYAPIDSQFCGGTVVDPEWVLTAAHCVTNHRGRPIRTNRVEALIGRERLSRRGGERIEIRDIVVAPGHLDLALLRLSRSSPEQAVLLPGIDDSSFVAPGTSATVLGWGDTVTVDEHDHRADGQPADDLLQGTLPIVAEHRCELVMGINHTTLGVATELCAGDARHGGTDACDGDSGGPLLVGTRFGWVLVGVVSWGDGCGLPSSLGVYTRVSTATAWITSTVSGVPQASDG